MSRPRSTYATLEEYEAKFGPQPKSRWNELQKAMDKADATIIAAFVGTQYSVPIQANDDISANRLTQWALRLASGDTTVRAEIERARDECNLNGITRKQAGT